MTSDLYKFGWLREGRDELPYEYENVWAKETTSGADRLVIAPRSNQTQFIQNLTKCLQSPFLLLYVLVVPRGEGASGRYESKYSFTSAQLQQFFLSYSDFLEHDARQNLWIRPVSGEGLIVYDRHNVIYAYGPLEQFVTILHLNGLKESNKVRFPSPHIHCYHDEFDPDAKRILQEEEWNLSPLRAGDENPD
jgi:hypothetical protein